VIVTIVIMQSKMMTDILRIQSTCCVSKTKIDGEMSVGVVDEK